MPSRVGLNNLRILRNVSNSSFIDYPYLSRLTPSRGVVSHRALLLLRICGRPETDYCALVLSITGARR